MAKLSEMQKRIEAYLLLHGDKEVTSISTTCGGGSKIEYTLNLHDIHEGNISTNRYTGRDEIDIPR